MTAATLAIVRIFVRIFVSIETPSSSAPIIRRRRQSLDAKLGRRATNEKCAESEQNPSNQFWWPSEHVPVQPLVIFPRVHVARNVRRIDEHPAHFVPMRVEDSAQPFLRI